MADRDTIARLSAPVSDSGYFASTGTSFIIRINKAITTTTIKLTYFETYGVNFMQKDLADAQRPAPRLFFSMTTGNSL